MGTKFHFKYYIFIVARRRSKSSLSKSCCVVSLLSRNYGGISVLRKKKA